VEIEEPLLAAGKASDNDAFRVDIHSLERGTMGNRGNYERPAVLETNEAAIEKMINARCQEKPILAVEPFFMVESRQGLQ
jgi:hypothetical protein